MAWKEVNLTGLIDFIAAKTAKGITVRREIGQPVNDVNPVRKVVNEKGEDVEKSDSLRPDWLEVRFSDLSGVKVEGIYSGPPGVFIEDAP